MPTIQVPVTVSGGVIQPVPQINVPKGGVSTIQWTVQTPGWQFPGPPSQYTGIVIKNGGPQFNNLGPDPSDAQVYLWSDANQVAGPYAYTITLVGPGGTITHDPTILNEP